MITRPPKIVHMCEKDILVNMWHAIIFKENGPKKSIIEFNLDLCEVELKNNHMENRKKTQPFCDDIVKSLARDNKNFHRSIYYKWSLRKSAEENQIDKL